MRTRHFGGVCAAAALLLVGCTSARSTTTTPSRAAQSSAFSATTTPSTAAPPTPSVDPRVAVEQTWNAFWSVTVSMYSVAPSLVNSTISSVAVDPVHTQMLEEIKLFDSLHIVRYGYVVSHPYSVIVTGGQAVLKDCLDTSDAGSKYTTTGARRSVGIPRDNTTATLLMGTDGKWRVKSVVYLEDVKC